MSLVLIDSFIRLRLKELLIFLIKDVVLSWRIICGGLHSDRLRLSYLSLCEPWFTNCSLRYVSIEYKSVRCLPMMVRRPLINWVSGLSAHAGLLDNRSNRARHWVAFACLVCFYKFINVQLCLHPIQFVVYCLFVKPSKLQVVSHLKLTRTLSVLLLSKLLF